MLRTTRLVAGVVATLALVAPATGHAFENGRAAPGDLSAIYIPGNTASLAKGPAAAWNTMRNCSVSAGVDIFPNASSYSPAATAYRPGWIQERLRAQLGQNAAPIRYVNGRAVYVSNHGRGYAVDLNQYTMRPWIDRHGADFGWQKVWSDAPWEPWHLAWREGVWPAGPDPGTSQRYPVLRRGTKSRCLTAAVKEAQRRLGGTPTGSFRAGLEKRVRNFQTAHKLKADGVVGPATWTLLREVTRQDGPGAIIKPPGVVKHPTTGVDVKAAQGLLNTRFRELHSTVRLATDGVYGSATTAAVRDFQAIRGLSVDGRIGEKTWGQLRLPARAPAISAKILQRAMPGLAASRARDVLPGLNLAMRQGGMTTPRRARYFLAQVGHESVSLRYFEEIASGAQYEGRRDLGNTHPGDGRRFKGRGPIQLTGRYNYAGFGAWAKSHGLVTDADVFVDHPTRVAEFRWGFLAAVYFWDTRSLNALSDRREFTALSRRINGGYNGLADRRGRLLTIARLGDAVLPAGTQR